MVYQEYKALFMELTGLKYPDHVENHKAYNTYSFKILKC
jgi:hypothetical protein